MPTSDTLVLWSVSDAGWRWYDPVIGRWLSNDPIGISGGLNQYVFCDNDAVNNIDPEGDESRPADVDFGQGYTGNVNPMPGPGGTVRGHVHVMKGGEEVAKVTEKGAWMRAHRGVALLRPSQVPRSVRNSINSFLPKMRRLFSGGGRAFGIIMYLPDIVDVFEVSGRAKDTGRSFWEELQKEYEETPYMEWPPGSGLFYPNPGYKKPPIMA